MRHEIKVEKLLAKKKAFLRPDTRDAKSYLEYHKAMAKTGSYEGSTGSVLPRLKFVEVTQDDFIRELNPETHAVNDPMVRPNIPLTSDGQPPNIKDLQEGKQEIVAYAMRARVAISEQEIIADRQLVHLFGNSLDLSLFKGEDELYSSFKKYWKHYRAHDAMMLAAESVLKTGDGAVVFYIDKGDIKFKIWSYMFGNSVSKHEAVKDVSPECVTRLYSGPNPDNEDETIELCQVYTDTEVYTYRKSKPDGDNKDEWTLVKAPELHGFKQIPVAYKKGKDVAWGSVQRLIEAQEESLSDFREANKKVGQDILVIKSDALDVMPNMSAGVSIIDVGEEGDASKLEAQDEPKSFIAELRELQERERSTTGTVVIPPDALKGGDHSGAYIKNLYFPAIQKAIKSIPEWSEFVQKCLNIMVEATGLIEGKPLEYRNMKITYDLKPYVPENRYEVAQINQLGVLAGFISKEDAAENTQGNSPDAFEKIKRERQEEYNLKFTQQPEL